MTYLLAAGGIILYLFVIVAIIATIYGILTFFNLMPDKPNTPYIIFHDDEDDDDCGVYHYNTYHDKDGGKWTIGAGSSWSKKE